MFRIAKAVTIALALIAATTVATVPAHSADRPTSLPECAKSTAKPHDPLTVKQPKSPAKKFLKTLTLTTNCGDIVISLNPKAPQTITNMSALANGKYFDRSLCHRLTTAGIFVLQCGDPTYRGDGNPTGWSVYDDENLPVATGINYPAGTVAMANPARPNSNGSQFFLVYADTHLGPNYTIWGKITQGLDLVKKIAEIGSLEWQGTQAIYAPDGDGEPIQRVEIIRARAK